MSNSLKIVPTNDSSKVTLKDTANHHGLHDTLKYGPKSLASQHNNQLPIQSRLENTVVTEARTRGQWEQTQDDLKLNLYRNIYGLHAPVRMMMERKIVAQASAGPTASYVD
ncbi:SubName: Full=Related to UMP1-proteasome maturation factor {ECO:0000313/EMBL:CCA73905.1} [Serendipita indica DSM 11827]|nr:SubName: Full=Related to UMP1-proteasome maturation factor {ECO:0000313/EMBL:CCA73905.1} [Serendipita indica DSM 11827]